MGYVYILKSQKNSRYYIGSTDNLEGRLIEHNSGKSNYTKLIRPFELIFKQEFETLTKARKIETWLKKQKDRDFIERIIKEQVIKKKLTK